MQDNFVMDDLVVDSSEGSQEVNMNLIIQDIFKNVPIETLTSDITFFKETVNKLTSSKHQKFQDSDILLLFLEHLSRNVNINLVSPQIEGFINSLSLQILATIDFKDVFQNHESKERFNNFLCVFFEESNDLQAQRLKESLIRCKMTYNINNELFFFQIFTVQHLFNNRLYFEINSLIDHFKIDDFDSVLPDEDSYLLNRIFCYLHHLGYSLIVTGFLERAYTLISATLLLTLETIDLETFHILLTEIVYLSLKLNISNENLNITIVKYRIKMLPRVSDLLQNFYVYDFESFACNYLLMVLNFKNKNQNLLIPLFTESFLNDCIHQLLQNKLHVFIKKLGNSAILEYETNVNLQLQNLNRKYNEFALEIQPFEYRIEQATIDRATHLANYQSKLLCASHYLNQISDSYIS